MTLLGCQRTFKKVFQFSQDMTLFGDMHMRQLGGEGEGNENLQTCWPSRQEIWEKLTWEPFAPVTVIIARQFLGNGLTWPPGRQICNVNTPSRQTSL